jgi:hypothetical protein
VEHGEAELAHAPLVVHAGQGVHELVAHHGEPEAELDEEDGDQGVAGESLGHLAAVAPQLHGAPRAEHHEHGEDEDGRGREEEESAVPVHPREDLVRPATLDGEPLQRVQRRLRRPRRRVPLIPREDLAQARGRAHDQQLRAPELADQHRMASKSKAP